MNNISLNKNNFNDLPFDKIYQSHYGQYRGLAFAISKFDNKTYNITLPYTSLDKDSFNDIPQAWKNLMEEKRRKERVNLLYFERNTNGTLMQLSGNKKNLNEKTFFQAIKLIIDSLIDKGIDRDNTCSVCKIPTKQLVYYKGEAKPICSDCTEAIREKDSQSPKAYQYITGLVGAFLGAIIASFTYIFIAYKINLLIALVAFIFGFVSLKAYQIFKGARKIWYANLVVSIATIISTLLISYIYLGNLFDKLFTILLSIVGLSLVYSQSPRLLSKTDLYVFIDDNNQDK